MHRPPFDPAAFVAGVVCIVVAALGLLDPQVARRIDLGVLWPVTLMTVGLALLATARLPRRHPGGTVD
jgi:hypothetical protein